MVMVVVVMIMVVLLMVMVVVMLMAVMVLMKRFGFLFSVYGNSNMRPGDAALDAAFHFYLDSGNTDAVHSFNKSFPVRNELQKSCRKHIARCAHSAVNK